MAQKDRQETDSHFWLVKDIQSGQDFPFRGNLSSCDNINI